MGLRQLLHSEPYRGLKDSSSSLIVESTDHRDSGYGQEQFEQRKPGNTFLRHDTDNDADENEECTEFVAAEDGHDPSRLIVHTVDAMIAQYTSLSSLTRSKGVEEESHAEPEDAITSAAANAEGSLRNSGSSLAEPTPSADLVRRTLIVYEIYTSEHSYVNSLMSLKRQYYDELLRYVDTPDEVVSRRQVNAMFGNLLEIVLVNSELLARIESRLFAPQAIRNGLGLTTLGTVKSRDTLAWKPDMPFADVLGEMAPFLKCYSAYARNFNSALQETSRMLSNNARFAAFLKSAERNSALGLQALLILPIQRIPRYRLLLADLLKHTASSHADMTNLTSTFKIVEDVATYVNEDIRQYEMQIELLGVQKSLVGYGEQLVMPGRRLLKMGGVRKVSRRTVDDRVLILLSDALLIASPVTMPSVGSRIGQAPQPLLFHRLIALASCRVEGVADNPVHQHIFQLCTQEKSFVVMTDCERTKLDWISAIRQAIDQAQSSPVRTALEVGSNCLDFHAL
ncbi:hypothetical protein RI367_005777 [Sorochytrium milnesiophthora]